jgi:hypothetical protein
VATAAGLCLSFVSAIAVNWAYSRQHDAVSEMPRFSLRRPLELVLLLARSTDWLVSLGVETAGWLCYLAALRLAPLSLVQGVGASGIAVLAFATARGHPSRLARGEQLAVLAGFTGLLLLSLSLVDTTQRDTLPGPATVVVWIAATFAGAALLASSRPSMARAPALGLAAGLLFAGGDICSKLVVAGHLWIVAALPLLVAYVAGTGLLQSAFQHGDALTGAGLAVLATNAVPIAAGFVLFDEQLPHGVKGVLQPVGFAALVAGAILLARRRAPGAPAALVALDAPSEV